MKLSWFLKRGFQLFFYRLRTQGIYLTLLWLYGRGTPILTGIPIMKYSQITPEIYVGPQYRQAGKERLERLGINGSINLRIEFDDQIHGLELKEHCYLPVINDHAPTIEQLEKGVTFAQQIIANGGKVYIHCQGGLGRAPTMAVAYFISQGLTINDAIKLIKQTRPFIEIKPSQMTQLELFQSLHHQNT